MSSFNVCASGDANNSGSSETSFRLTEFVEPQSSNSGRANLITYFKSEATLNETAFQTALRIKEYFVRYCSCQCRRQSWSATPFSKVCLLEPFSDIFWKIVLESRAFGQNTRCISSNPGGCCNFPRSIPISSIDWRILFLRCDLISNDEMGRVR
jgi:hypothetical protein